MPLVTNESLGKGGGKLILAEISNKTTLWYHTIWRKTCCQKIKCTIYPHIKQSLGAQDLQSGAYTCRQIVGRAQYNWICLLPENDLSEAVVQTGKYRSLVTFAEPFCSVALGHADSPWARHVQLQGGREKARTQLLV